MATREEIKAAEDWLNSHPDKDKVLHWQKVMRDELTRLQNEAERARHSE